MKSRMKRMLRKWVMLAAAVGIAVLAPAAVQAEEPADIQETYKIGNVTYYNAHATSPFEQQIDFLKELMGNDNEVLGGTLTDGTTIDARSIADLWLTAGVGLLNTDNDNFNDPALIALMEKAVNSSDSVSAPYTGTTYNNGVYTYSAQRPKFDGGSELGYYSSLAAAEQGAIQAGGNNKYFKSKFSGNTDTKDVLVTTVLLTSPNSTYKNKTGEDLSNALIDEVCACYGLSSGNWTAPVPAYSLTEKADYVRRMPSYMAMSDMMVAVYFSDFKVVPLLPEDEGSNYVVLQSTSTPEGSETYASNVKNLTDATVSSSQSLSSSHDMTVSSSVSGSESYEFSEEIKLGMEFEFTSAFKASSELTVSASQAFENGWENGTEVSDSISFEDTISVDLPPYTNVVLTQKKTKTESVVAFNCPIALKYKVTIVPYGTYNLYMQEPVTNLYGGTDEDGTYLYDKEKYTFGDDARLDLRTRAVVNRNYTEKDPDRIRWPIVDQFGGVGEAIQLIAGHIPDSPTGAQYNVTFRATTTEVSGLLPIYPLSSIKLNSDNVSFIGNKTGTTADYNYLTANMKVGDFSYTEYLDLEGYNTVGAEYYGFDKDCGKWVIVNEEGDEWSAGDGPVPVTLKKIGANQNWRYQAVAPGTCFLKYVIDENTYNSIGSPGSYTTNAQLTRTAALEVNVTRVEENTAPEETISIAGTYNGYINEAAESLEKDGALSVSICDANGKELSVPYIWEKKELDSKGISLDEKGNVSFTKTGTFHVRAVCSSLKLTSKWVEITADKHTYKITLVPQNGEESKTITTETGTAITDPDAPSKCTTFTGWYTNKACTKAYDVSKGFTSDMTLYGGWKDSHSLKQISAVAATCTKAGRIAYCKCSVCGKLFSDAKASKEITAKDTVIAAMGHDWGKWTVVREATTKKAGLEQRVCKHNSKHVQKRSIPKLTVKSSPFIRAYSKKSTKSTITLNWTKVKGATSYVIYGGRCGDALRKLDTLSSVNRFVKISKIQGKKLKQNVYYKFYVAAYGKDSSGNEVELCHSQFLHLVTKGSEKYGNISKVVLKTKKAVTLSKGGTTKVKAVQKKEKNKKVQIHQKVTYVSTNPNVAKVGSTSGIVKAVASGNCVIYCLAQNGLCKTVKVTVK